MELEDLEEMEMLGGLEMLREVEVVLSSESSRGVEVLRASTSAVRVVRGRKQRRKVKMLRIVPNKILRWREIIPGALIKDFVS